MGAWDYAHPRDEVRGWSLGFSLSSSVLVLIIIRLVYAAIGSYLNYKADMALGIRHGCKPPPQLPNRWPLGLDRLKELWQSNAEGRLLAFLCSVAVDYEPRNNLSQYLLFGPRAFHVLDPRNVETILSTKFSDYGFGLRAGVFAPLLGDGIFTQEGPSWKHSRELLRKQFVRTQYQNLGRFRQHVDNLINLLPSDGTIDLQPLFFGLTLDTTTALLMGQSVNSLKADVANNSEHRAFAENFNDAQEGLAKRFRLAPWHAFYAPASFKQACTAVHSFVERYIEKRKLEKKSSTDADEAFEFIDQVAEESASTEALRDQLLNVLLAGRDTTACSLSWTFRLLVRHKNALDRLRAEIQDVMGDEPIPTRAQIRSMPYLANVIKESLRLYPPVPLNNRTAVETTILPAGGGPDGLSPILVRKGELVVFSQYVNSRKKNIYGPDAYEFRPERWEDGGLSDIGWAYFPFNGGPRTCLGQDYALMLMSYAIVRILQACHSITLPEGEKIEPTGMEKQRLTLVLSSADGCRVKVLKRNVGDSLSDQADPASVEII